MSNYKIIILIISSLIMLMFTFVVVNTFILDNNHKGYDVDKGYIQSYTNKEEDIAQDIIAEEKTSSQDNLKEAKVEEDIINSNQASNLVKVVSQEKEEDEAIKEVPNVEEESKYPNSTNELEGTSTNDVEEEGGQNIQSESISESTHESSTSKSVDVEVVIDNNLDESTNSEETSVTDEEQTTTIQQTEETSTIIPEYTGTEWVDEKIEEHIDEIAEIDIAVGLSMVDKIDGDVLMEYLKDGLSETEREELKMYLASVLSPSEYEKLKVLIDKYYYILEN